MKENKKKKKKQNKKKKKKKKKMYKIETFLHIIYVKPNGRRYNNETDKK